MAQTIFKRGIAEKLRTLILSPPKIEKQYCRLCLSYVVINFKNLFSLFNTAQSIAEVIEDHAKVTILQEDEYSKLICSVCFSKLKETENFKLLIESSDLKLRNQQTVCEDPLETIAIADDNDKIDEDSDHEKIDIDEIDLKKEIRVKCTELLKNTDESNLVEAQSEDDSQTIEKDTDLVREPISSTVENDASKMEKIENINVAPIEDSKPEAKARVKQPKMKNSPQKTKSTNVRILKKNIRKLCKPQIIRQTEPKHQCKFCGSYFNADKSYVNHIKTHKDIKAFECDQCPKGFMSRRRLRLHQIRKHPSNKSEFERKQLLDIKDKQKNYKCGECDKSFQYDCHLRRHMSRHTGIYPFHCSFCRKGFPSGMARKIHEFTHTREAQYQCEICGKGFMQKFHFLLHQMMHNNVKPLKCNQCNKEFSNKYNLNTHVINTHSSNTQESNFLCNICNKKFKIKFLFQKHMRTIHKPFKLGTCNICGKAVKKLNAHMKAAHLKPYKCTVCNQSFGNSTILREHSFVHTGQRLYECDICKKTFRFNGSLHKHRKTHDVKNHFKCEFCDKKFLYKHHLKLHLEKVHQS